ARGGAARPGRGRAGARPSQGDRGAEAPRTAGRVATRYRQKCAGCVRRTLQPPCLSQTASWHASGGTHPTGFVPLHTPAWQVSVRVQALPSLQAVPSGFAGLEQAPVAGSQVPASWHWSAAAQTTGVCVQPAGEQASIVQGLLSSQLADAPNVIAVCVALSKVRASAAGEATLPSVVLTRSM